MICFSFSELIKYLFSKKFFEKNSNQKKSDTKSNFDFFKCFEKYLTLGKLSKAYNTIKAQTTIKYYLDKFEKETGFVITFEKLNDR